MKKLSPFGAYTVYQSVLAHFNNPKYDCFKYRFQTKTSERCFENTGMVGIFEGLAKKHPKDRELAHFFATLYAVYDITHVSKMVSNHEKFSEHKGKLMNLSYHYESQLKACMKRHSKTFPNILKPRKGGDMPHVLDDFLAGYISLEVLIALNKVTGFLKHSRKEVQDPLSFPEIVVKIEKFSPFLSFSHEKILEKTRNLLKSSP